MKLDEKISKLYRRLLTTREKKNYVEVKKRKPYERGKIFILRFKYENIVVVKKGTKIKQISYD